MDHLTATENLLTAIETVAKSVVDKVQYDKTLTCTIVDSSAAADGKYIVTDGSTKFAAYSETTSFKNGDVVYVTIPNGDMTEQKVILGRKTSDATEPFNYKSPFDNLLICSPDLINKSNEQEDIIAKIKTNNSENNFYYLGSILEEECQKYRNFDKIGLKARFQTVLPSEKLVSGDYGIRANITYTDTIGSDKYVLYKEDGWRKDREYYIQSLYYHYQNENNEDIYELFNILNEDKYDKKENGDLIIYYPLKNEYIEYDSTKHNKFKKVSVRSQKNDNDYTDYSKINIDNEGVYQYKPNFFYYRNYILDNSLVPRKGEEYYYFNEDTGEYKKIICCNFLNNDYIQIYSENGDIIEKEAWSTYKQEKKPFYTQDDNTPIYFYIPNTFYRVDKNKEFILSEDNGWDSKQQYFTVFMNENEILTIQTENEDYNWKEDYDFLLDKGKFNSIILSKNNYKPFTYYVKEQEEKTVNIPMFLNTFDMIGQPYNFVVPINQEKVFDISKIKNIKKIDFYLYQDNNFIALNGEKYNEAIEDNIFLINLEMYFGYDISNIEDEYLQIFTTDPLNSYQAYNSIEDICKKIKLKWVHVIDDKSYVIDNDHLNYFDLSAAADIESAITKKPNDIVSLLKPEEGTGKIKYNLKLDNGAYTEDRIYLTRTITSLTESNVVNCNYNFIKNYTEEFNENREYYEKKYILKNEAEGQPDGTINTFKYYKLQVEPINKNTAFNEESDYLIQDGYKGTNIWRTFGVTSNSEILTNGYFNTNEYNGNSIFERHFVFRENETDGTHIECYIPKKVTKQENISSLYYIDFKITTDNSGNAYLQLFPANIDEKSYESGKYYYLENINKQDIDIRWYRYKEGAPSADEYSGVYWERIPLWQDENKPPLGKDYLQNLFELDFYPDPIYHKTEQIKVIAIYNDKPIYSNILEFTNDDPVINLPTIEQENALRMRFEDETNGKYFMYNENNQLIDMGNAQQIREIILLFDKDDFTSNSVLNNAEQVQWIVPKNNSMINIVDINDGNITEDDRFYYITDTVKRHEYKFKYTINKMYSFSRDNNTIVCNVFKDGTLYSSTQSLSFGQSGSNGSEYTLVLNLLSSDQVVTLNKQDQDVFYKTFEPLDMENENISKKIEDKLYICKKLQDKNCYIQITLDEWDQNEQLYTQTKYVKTIKDTIDDDYARGEYYIYNNDIYDYVLLNQNTPYPVDKVQAVLYDQNYNKVSIPEGATFRWEWVSSYNELENGFEDVDQTLFDNIEEINDIITLQINSNCANPFEQVCILKVILQNFGDYDLISYLPIPIRSDYGPVQYQGPTQIIYSSYGAPNYYSNDIVLYYNDEEGNIKPYPEGIYNESNNITGFKVFQASNKIEDTNFYQEHNKGKYVYNKEDKVYTEYEKSYENPDYIEDYHYRILKEFNENNEEQEIKKIIRYEKIENPTLKEESSFIPWLLLKEEKTKEDEQETIKKHIVFKPSELFINDIGMFAIQYWYNGTQIWSQPILYMQNRYFSSTLNKWDGSLKVDEENNTILAQSFAAGRKESDNSFSGLIMGDWSQKVNATESASGDFDITKSTGLYAFNHGATSFGLNDNGQMFLGKSGRGRIYFDGENATIGSADWCTSGNRVGRGGTGLLLDIDDGFLISRNSDGQYIKIDSLANKNGNEIKEFVGRNDDCDHPDDNDPYYTPDRTPTAGGTRQEYPFVVYGDKDNFTAIGWRGNLLLHGTQPDGDGGAISLNASARYLPINVNKHFGVGWNGALIISDQDIAAKVTDNYLDFGFDKNYIGSATSSSNFPTAIIAYNDTAERYWNQNIKNKYDYTELQYTNGQYGFNGFYATPYGDLYLSRKLIIGNEFSVTGEGYLKASNALFDKCNANTFTLKYVPYSQVDDNDKAITRNEFLRMYYEDDNKVPTMGQLGYVTGSTDEEQTDNVGIRSYRNFGIKLTSNRDISITARVTEKDIQPFSDWTRSTKNFDTIKHEYADGGNIYLESQRFQLGAFKTISIAHEPDPLLGQGGEKTEGNDRIQLHSSHELYERGNKILLQVNDRYDSNNHNKPIYEWSEGKNKESIIIEPNAIQLYLGGNSYYNQEYIKDDNGMYIKLKGEENIYHTISSDQDLWYTNKNNYVCDSNGNIIRYKKTEQRSETGDVIADGTARILLGYPILNDTNIYDHPFIIKETQDKKKNRIEIYTINGGASYIDVDDRKEKPKIANLILLDHCKENGLMGAENRDLVKIASQNEVLLIAGPKEIKTNNGNVIIDYNFNKNTGDNVGLNYFKLYNNNGTGTADLVTTNSIFFSTNKNKITMKNAIGNTNNHPQTEILSSATNTDRAILTLEPSRVEDQKQGQTGQSGGTAILEATREVKLVTRGNTNGLTAAIYLLDNHIYFNCNATNQHGIYARFA